VVKYTNKFIYRFQHKHRTFSVQFVSNACVFLPEITMESATDQPTPAMGSTTDLLGVATESSTDLVAIVAGSATKTPCNSNGEYTYHSFLALAMVKCTSLARTIVSILKLFN
jgi:hypothetical protein